MGFYIGMPCGFMGGVSRNWDPFKDTRRLPRVRPPARGVTTTLYFLVDIMEAFFPIEIEIHYLRVLIELKFDKVEDVRAKYEQLNLVDEKRLMSLCHNRIY